MSKRASYLGWSKIIIRHTNTKLTLGFQNYNRLIIIQHSRYGFSTKKYSVRVATNVQ